MVLAKYYQIDGETFCKNSIFAGIKSIYKIDIIPKMCNTVIYYIIQRFTEEKRSKY